MNYFLNSQKVKYFKWKHEIMEIKLKYKMEHESSIPIHQLTTFFFEPGFHDGLNNLENP